MELLNNAVPKKPLKTLQAITVAVDLYLLYLKLDCTVKDTKYWNQRK